MTRKPPRTYIKGPNLVAREMILGRNENNTRSYTIPNKKRQANRLACRRSTERP